MWLSAGGLCSCPLWPPHRLLASLRWAIRGRASGSCNVFHNYLGSLSHGHITSYWLHGQPSSKQVGQHKGKKMMVEQHGEWLHCHHGSVNNVLQENRLWTELWVKIRVCQHFKLAALQVAGKMHSLAQSFEMDSHVWRAVRSSSWQRQLVVAEGKKKVCWGLIYKRPWIHLKLNSVDFLLEAMGSPADMMSSI